MSDVHVMYRGSQDDFSFDELFPEDRYEAIGIDTDTVVSPQTVNQTQIRAALAQHYDVGLNEFNDHHIEINKNGNITVRANTPFG